MLWYVMTYDMCNLWYLAEECYFKLYILATFELIFIQNIKVQGKNDMNLYKITMISLFICATWWIRSAYDVTCSA